MKSNRKQLNTRAIASGIVCILLASPAQSQDNEVDPPKAFSDAVACREIMDDTERLACYDAAMGALAQASADKEIMVVSREEVRQTRRGLFGLKLPKLFGGGDDSGEEELKEITATIAEVRGGRGSYTFVLEDGAVWSKSESGFLRQPKVGQTITIRKGALGSYFGKVENGVSFRIRRVN